MIGLRIRSISPAINSCSFCWRRISKWTSDQSRQIRIKVSKPKARYPCKQAVSWYWWLMARSRKGLIKKLTKLTKRTVGQSSKGIANAQNIYELLIESGRSEALAYDEFAQRKLLIKNRLIKRATLFISKTVNFRITITLRSFAGLIGMAFLAWANMS